MPQTRDQRRRGAAAAPGSSQAAVVQQQQQRQVQKEPTSRHSTEDAISDADSEPAAAAPDPRYTGLQTMLRKLRSITRDGVKGQLASWWDRCVVDHYDEEVKAMVKKILDAYDSPAAANRTRYKQVPSWSLAEQCLLHHLAMGNLENLCVLLAAEPGHRAIQVFSGALTATQLTAEEEEKKVQSLRNNKRKKGDAQLTPEDVERKVREVREAQQTARELQRLQAQLRKVAINQMATRGVMAANLLLAHAGEIWGSWNPDAKVKAVAVLNEYLAVSSQTPSNTLDWVTGFAAQKAVQQVAGQAAAAGAAAAGAAAAVAAAAGGSSVRTARTSAAPAATALPAAGGGSSMLAYALTTEPPTAAAAAGGGVSAASTRRALDSAVGGTAGSSRAPTGPAGTGPTGPQHEKQSVRSAYAVGRGAGADAARRGDQRQRGLVQAAPGLAALPEAAEGDEEQPLHPTQKSPTTVSAAAAGPPSGGAAAHPAAAPAAAAAASTAAGGGADAAAGMGSTADEIPLGLWADPKLVDTPDQEGCMLNARRKLVAALLQAPHVDGLFEREDAYAEHLVKHVVQATSIEQLETALHTYGQHKQQAELLLWLVKQACGLSMGDETIGTYLESKFGSSALGALSGLRLAAFRDWVQAAAAGPAAAGDVPDAVTQKDQQVLAVLKQAALLFHVELFREDKLELIKLIGGPHSLTGQARLQRVKHKVPEELVVSKRLAVAIMGPDGLTLSEAKEKELLNSLGVVIQPMEFILGEVAAAQVVSSKVAMNLLGLHRTRETIYVDRAVQGYIWYVHMDMPYLGEDVDALQHKLWRDTQFLKLPKPQQQQILTLVVLCLLEGLARCFIDMHREGVVHQDGKPTNMAVHFKEELDVLTTIAYGTVHIFDWGSSQLPRPFAEQGGAEYHSQVSRAGTKPLISPDAQNKIYKKVKGGQDITVPLDITTKSDIFKAGISMVMVLMAEPRLPRTVKGKRLTIKQMWAKKRELAPEEVTLEPEETEEFVAALSSSLQAADAAAADGTFVPLPPLPYLTHPADDPSLADVYTNVNDGTWSSTVANNAAELAKRLLPRSTGYAELASLIRELISESPADRPTAEKLLNKVHKMCVDRKARAKLAAAGQLLRDLAAKGTSSNA